MSIPKVIHYCWFGRNPKPKLAEKCIKSWKKHCPDYEIIEWNEDNFDISSCPLYVRQAYEVKKWAFVTDYVRLQVVYENGGIYMDTDVELKKKLDPLLEYNAYFGFEDEAHIATGLGFGAVKGTPILMEMMEDYQDISFIRPDGSFDIITCPMRNTETLLRHGLKQNDTKQVLDDRILILPAEYMCPISFWSGKKHITINTISIHWFSASWKSAAQRKQQKKYAREIKRKTRRDFFSHIPNRIVRNLIGRTNYEKLKAKLKNK